ncbi:MAG TPA: hypothetical protein VF756_31930 [Thermoanaerobaculia bacterium]
MRVQSGFAVVVFLAAAVLSMKTGWDLAHRAGLFPSWFVPCFVAGLAVLLGCAAWVTSQIWQVRGSARPATGSLATAVWLLLPLSFICTSAVHQLCPFRPDVVEAWRSVGPVLRFNFTLTLVGFLAVAALGLLYRSGRRGLALVGLMVLALALLVPNDDCPNPFNEWWLATIGASPLMFVPNLYASLFALAALLGVRPRWSVAALAATCFATLLLGLGHMTRVIW